MSLALDDFEVVEATYRAAVARWPMARITLHESAQQEWTPDGNNRAVCTPTKETGIADSA
jgi:hypothetical protein